MADEKTKNKKQKKQDSFSTFKLLIMDPDRVIYEGDATNLFLQGDTGEFEVLAHHYPVISVLTEGKLVIDWKYYVKIMKGIVRFFGNYCVVIVELKESYEAGHM